jgi:hypothetical protein
MAHFTLTIRMRTVQVLRSESAYERMPATGATRGTCLQGCHLGQASR